jgi:ribosomal protein S18 acetylase RimI-like enzyme
MKMNDDFRENFVSKESTSIFLSDPKNWIYACLLNEKIIGFAYGYELNRLDQQGNMLYIHEIGVLEAYQRKGIGFQIMNDMKNICKKKGICRMFLFTQRHNMAACKLYEKMGGEKTSEGDDVTYFIPTA